MAEILPFAGLRYVREKVGDLSLVVAPPYDVISSELQDTLYQRHMFNIVRLIRTKGDNPYEEADIQLKRWKSDGILATDPSPGIYLYRHRFRLSEKRPIKTRRGFIALYRLEDFGSGRALPHEKTLAAPKDDRLKLLEATRTNLCPIFAVYSHKELDAHLGKLMGRKPEVLITDDDRVEHAIWRLTDKKEIESIQRSIQDRGFIIADGHHRYEAAMSYRNRQRGQNPEGASGPHDFVMLYFTSMEGRGLTILPTHRLVSDLKNLDIEGYLTRIEKFFSVMEFPLSGGEQWALDMLMEGMKKLGAKSRVYGLIFKEDRAYYLLAVKEKEFMSEEVTEKLRGISAPLLDLDVTVLHSFLLPELASGESPSLQYVHRAEEAVAVIKGGSAQVAFLLSPTRISQIARVTEAGEVMPPKSTYFYPKLLSGLVLRPL